MALSDFAIFAAFDRIWETYKLINPEREASSRKAFEVACKTGADPKQIEQAVLIYYHESLSTDPQYRYQFGNFIREKYYQDYIDRHRDMPAYLAALEAEKEAAEALLLGWNKACRAHWCAVIDIPTKVGLAKRTLQDEAFKKHWEKALDIASKIFYKPLHSTDPRSKVNLTFRWFTTIGEKHTVMRLVEGEYGRPEEPDKPLPPRKVVSDEEAAKIAEENKKLWEEVFGKKEETKDEAPPDPMENFGIITDENGGTIGFRD
jgi:hypothetical protein